MADNELLPFATAIGANVLSQAEYDGLTGRGSGFGSGTALSPQVNKVWRQASFVAAMIGQFAADNSGEDTLDDGDVPRFLDNFTLALQQAVSNKFPIGTAAGTANAITTTLDPVPSSWDNLRVFLLKIAATNTGAVTVNPNGLGARAVKSSDGAPLNGGELRAGRLVLLGYDGTALTIIGSAPSVPVYVVDEGDPNAMAGLSYPSLLSMERGQVVYVNPENLNTGATSLNVNGTGTKAVVLQGGALPPGSTVPGVVLALVYDGAAFQVVGGLMNRASFYYVEDVGTANVLAGPAYPNLTAYRRGQVFEVYKSGTAGPNTGAVTFNVSSLGAKNVFKRDGFTTLRAGDWAPGEPMLLVYDGAAFRVMNTLPSDFATAGVAFNIQRYTNNTRVVVNGAQDEYVPVWTGINFEKKSATSTIIAHLTFGYVYASTIPASYVRLSNGTQSGEIILSAPATAYTLSCTGIFPIEGCPKGANTFVLSLTNPGSAFIMRFNATSADYNAYRATPQATLLLQEVELP